MSYAKQLALLNEAVITGDVESMLPKIRPARGDQISPRTRLAVYADGYKERLVKAVLADYPALAYYVGEERITAAIGAYITATPSTRWDLNLYPVGFADFFAREPNAAAVALAKLESAVIEIFWRPESEPLSPHMLAALAPDELADIRFKPRASLQLLQFDWAANAYLQSFRDGAAPPYIEAHTEYLALVRSNNEVKRIVLEATEHQLLIKLTAGVSFGEALEEVGDETLAAQLPHYLSRWLAYGFFAA